MSINVEENICNCRGIAEKKLLDSNGISIILSAVDSRINGIDENIKKITDIEDSIDDINTRIDSSVDDINTIKNNTPIVKGDAENSAVLKGGNNTVTGNYSAAIGYGNTVNNDSSVAFGYNNKVKANCCFSAGSNNEVSGENSHAEGLNTKAGVKGFYFKGIDIKNKKIYLSTTKPDTIKTSGFAHSDFENIDFPYDIEADMLSIINGNIYYDCLKVTRIKNKSVIYVESLPFESVAEFNELFKNSNYTIFCLSKYKLGVVSVSFGCHSEGYETCSFGFGSHSDGYNTIAKNVGEHASGIYNVSNSDTQFSIGMGTSDTDRKNAFEVKQNGDIYINGIEGNVQSNITNLNTSISTLSSKIELLENLIEELQNTIQLQQEILDNVFIVQPDEYNN